MTDQTPISILGDMIVVVGRDKKSNERVKRALIRSIVNNHPDLTPTPAELRKIAKRQEKAAK